MQNQPQNAPSIQLDNRMLSIISAVCGIITFILLFFPDSYVVTLILGIIAVALGIWTYIFTRSWISLIGIIFGGFPLIFFLQLELISIYIKQLVFKRLF